MADGGQEGGPHPVGGRDRPGRLGLGGQPLLVEGHGRVGRERAEHAAVRGRQRPAAQRERQAVGDRHLDVGLVRPGDGGAGRWLATTCQLPGMPRRRSAEAPADWLPSGAAHSSSVTESMPNASLIRSSSALSPCWPRRTLPAVVASSSDSALARAACVVRRAAMSTTQLTSSATATNTPSASALFACAIVSWWIGGMK